MELAAAQHEKSCARAGGFPGSQGGHSLNFRHLESKLFEGIRKTAPKTGILSEALGNW